MNAIFLNAIIFLLGAFFGFATSALGAITDFAVRGRTATQAYFFYTAPDANACRLEVSNSPTYSPLVYDLDPSLFMGSDMDNRLGNLRNGTSRIFVVGKRATEYASDGRSYSRALQADRRHYYRLTCGNDQLTGTFDTTTIPFGNTYMESLPIDPSRPGEYLWPTIPFERGAQVIDPFTGVLFQRMATPKDINISTILEGRFAASPAPSGNGWNNPSGILADDRNSASYSGTGNDWLALSLGGAFPYDSTLGGSLLSYINLYLKGSCSGSGCNSGGNIIETCLTVNAKNCAGPIQRVTLGSSPSLISVCGSGSPCPKPELPGDTWTNDTIQMNSLALGKGRVYNNGYSSTLYFTSAEDCNMLRVNDRIQFFSNDSVMRAQYPHVDQLQCAANPPSMTMKDSGGNPFAYDVTAGGSTGIPFYYQSGMASNQRFGFLIRKASAIAGATINLDYGYIKSSVSAYPGRASGGFSKLCTSKRNANGFYHCQFSTGIYAVKPNSDGSLETHYLGIPYFYDSTLPYLTGGFRFCGGFGGGDMMWDDEDANTLYCTAYSTYGQVLLKLTYSGNDQDCGQPGSGCDAANFSSGNSWPRFPGTYTNLTPPGFDLDTQITQFGQTVTPPYDNSRFNRCGLLAIQGSYAIFWCLEGSQDTLGWMFAFDLGNRKPIGAGYIGSDGNTSQVIAGVPVFARPESRWCGLHTYQTMGADPIQTIETAANHDPLYSVNITQSLPACSKALNNCSPCPSNPSSKICSSMSVTSTFPGTPPAGWTAGEPTSLANPYGKYLQNVEVGDYLQHGTEVVRIVQKNSSTSWVVERGIGPDQSWQFPINHDVNSVFNAICYPSGVTWYFKLDPKGENPATYFETRYINHAVARNPYRIAPKFIISKVDFNNHAAMKAGAMTFELKIDMPYKFADSESYVEGNSAENHPSYSQVDAPSIDKKWFMDAHPFLGASVADPGDVAVIEGNLYSYNYNPFFYMDRCRAEGRTCDPKDAFQTKKADILASCGRHPLKNISSPALGNILGGTASDAYKYCVAEKAGECRSNSQPGNIFFNCPNIDPSAMYCRGGEFFVDYGDVCITHMSSAYASAAQYLIPENTSLSLNGAVSRILSRMWDTYRGSSTSNVTAIPDGSWYLPNVQGNNFLAKLPTTIGAQDGVNRSTFVLKNINISPVSGADKAIVEFGYSEFGSPNEYFCTSRRESCVAVSSTVDEKTPFKWRDTETFSGLSCSGGCQIQIPLLPHHIAYFQIHYHDMASDSWAPRYRGIVSEANVISIPMDLTKPSPPSSLRTRK